MKTLRHERNLSQAWNSTTGNPAHKSLHRSKTNLRHGTEYQTTAPWECDASDQEEDAEGEPQLPVAMSMGAPVKRGGERRGEEAKGGEDQRSILTTPPMIGGDCVELRHPRPRSQDDEGSAVHAKRSAPE